MRWLDILYLHFIGPIEKRSSRLFVASSKIGWYEQGEWQGLTGWIFRINATCYQIERRRNSFDYDSKWIHTRHSELNRFGVLKLTLHRRVRWMRNIGLGDWKVRKVFNDDRRRRNGVRVWSIVWFLTSMVEWWPVWTDWSRLERRCWLMNLFVKRPKIVFVVFFSVEEIFSMNIRILSNESNEKHWRNNIWYIRRERREEKMPSSQSEMMFLFSLSLIHSFPIKTKIDSNILISISSLFYKQHIRLNDSNTSFVLFWSSIFSRMTDRLMFSSSNKTISIEQEKQQRWECRR